MVVGDALATGAKAPRTKRVLHALLSSPPSPPLSDRPVLRVRAQLRCDYEEGMSNYWHGHPPPESANPDWRSPKRVIGASARPPPSGIEPALDYLPMLQHAAKRRKRPCEKSVEETEWPEWPEKLSADM